MFEGSSSMGVTGVVQKFKESYRKLRSMRLLDIRKLYEELEPMHLRRLLQEYRVDCVRRWSQLRSVCRTAATKGQVRRAYHLVRADAGGGQRAEGDGERPA